MTTGSNRASRTPALVIAAPNSGSGKTTVVTGLIMALRRRGLEVQPYKAGPDYIDPSYHRRAAGRPSRNLDTWMVPTDALRALYWRASASAMISVVEGVMGLFDGRGGGEEGSTAHLARLLGLPVVVVLDVGRMSRTAGAVALGCQRFDQALNVVGFVLNGVASENHRRWAGEAITAATGLPVFGWLPRREDLALPERHLGLIPTSEGRVDEEFFARLADQVEQSFDLDGLLDAARTAPDGVDKYSGATGGERDIGNDLPADARPLFPSEAQSARVTIGLAMDEAFSFYYDDNLDLLRAWGARLVPFSPLRDPALPDGIDALYLGGGFPELYAAALAKNQALKIALRDAATAGMPIYAECGGLMYLSETIVDFEGRSHPMVGLIPARSAMLNRRLTLGYRELRARVDTPLLRQGQVARGHEFHWSVLENPLPSDAAAYDVLAVPVPTEGYARDNLLASYCHLHFASNPDLAPNFVTSATRWRRTGGVREGR